ncbi:MAG: hypothetical protein QM673_05740 [Gordonia sp. (in: high G+C Gram-positive bacteria)]
MSVRRGNLCTPRRRFGLVVLGVTISLAVSFGGEHGVSAAAPPRPIAIAGTSIPVNVAPVNVTSTHVTSESTPPDVTPGSSSRGEAPKECAGSRFATFGAIYDAVFDSFLPQLPASIRDNSTSIKAAAHRDMDRLRISTLAISAHPYDLGADKQAPIMTYRDPISEWIVTQLINVREGRTADAISVENLTLSQAVETVWLYVYVTVLIPLTIVRDSIPPIATLVGPITVGTLLSLPIMLGVFITNAFFNAISNGLVNACIVSVTKEQKARAGKPVKDLRFAWAVPGIVRDMAGQVSIADPATCPSIGTLPLSRIVTRTSNYLESVTTNPVTDRQIQTATNQLRQYMRTTRVHQNLVPADPADFNIAESVLSLTGTLVPFVGGAPFDAVIGLSHNHNRGDNFGASVPLEGLSVTKSLTAAYYAYAITTHIIEVVWEHGGTDVAAGLVSDLFPGLGISADLIPLGEGILSVPNVYGLVVYHNVLRSLCLTEDRKSAAVPTRIAAARW